MGAWTLLLLEPGIMTASGFCPAGMQNMSLSASLETMMTNHRFATMPLSWALMMTAMMAPLVMAPVRHIRDRSFARRRVGAIALFAAGYAALWMIAGVLLIALAMAAGQIVSGSASAYVVTISAIAVAWQFSPFKQRCLNRCHAHPELAAFGLAALLDAFRFGLKHGAWCVGSCWALMLFPLAILRGHLAAMIAVTLWLAAERLKTPVPPCWRWRSPSTAAHILRMAQMIVQRG
jgi:predicted metal-binding membrane protein